MNANISAFLTAAGGILSAGVSAVEDAVSLVDLMKSVLGKPEPSDDDWTALHAYEAKQTAALNAPMAGETGA